MPTEYKTYGCRFRCGHRHSERIKKIEQHESDCFLNPENKTCSTCENEISRDYYDGHIRECMHPAGDEMLKGMQEALRSLSGWVKPVFQCPYHGTEVTTEIVDSYQQDNHA